MEGTDKYPFVTFQSLYLKGAFILTRFPFALNKTSFPQKTDN